MRGTVPRHMQHVALLSTAAPCRGAAVRRAGMLVAVRGQAVLPYATAGPHSPRREDCGGWSGRAIMCVTRLPLFKMVPTIAI